MKVVVRNIYMKVTNTKQKCQFLGVHLNFMSMYIFRLTRKRVLRVVWYKFQKRPHRSAKLTVDLGSLLTVYIKNGIALLLFT